MVSRRGLSRPRRRPPSTHAAARGPASADEPRQRTKETTADAPRVARLGLEHRLVRAARRHGGHGPADELLAW